MPASICAKGIDICKNVEIIVWISQKFYANLESSIWRTFAGNNSTRGLPMKSPGISIPNQFLNFFSSKVPDVWKAVDYYRSMRGTPEDDWDMRVFMRLRPGRPYRKADSQKPGLRKGFAAKNLQVIGAWRPTQDILRFDDDFYTNAYKDAVTGRLPAEIIGRIPAWGVYFETRNLEVEGRHYDAFSRA